MYSVKVESDAQEGLHTNIATASASNHGSVSDAADVDIRNPAVLGGEPELTIEKTANVSFTNPGAIVIFTITVKNRGIGVAENVIVRDTLPPGFVETTSNASTVEWHLGDLAAEEERTITFQARVAQDLIPAIYRNVASVKADNHGSMKDTADVEIRAGDVLGFAELPATGGNLLASPFIRIGLTLLIMLLGIALLVDVKRLGFMR